MSINRRTSLLADRRAAAIIVCGLVVRLFVVMMRSGDLQVDADAYLAHAQTLATGNGFCVPGTTNPTAYRPPLFPVLLVALHWTGLAFSLAAAVLNLVAGTVTVYVSMQLARQLGLHHRSVLLVGFCVAFDPILLRYTVYPMTECLSAALLTTAILYLCRSVTAGPMEPDTSSSGWNGRHAVIAGIALGLCALCRPVAIVVAVFTAPGVFWYTRRHTSEGSTITARENFRCLTRSLVSVVVCGLVLTPWALRNLVVMKHLTPATTHGGYTLLLGNNDVFYRNVVQAEAGTVWEGASREAWQTELDKAMEEQGVTGEVATDRWMYSRAMETIRRHPGIFLRACLLRWTRFWAVLPHASAIPLPATVTAGIASWYYLEFVGLLAALGFLVRGLRHGNLPAAIGILWWTVVAFMVLHTVYWTNARMRAPLCGVIAVLSVYGWQQTLLGLRQILSQRLKRKD